MFYMRVANVEQADRLDQLRGPRKPGTEIGRQRLEFHVHRVVQRFDDPRHV